MLQDDFFSSIYDGRNSTKERFEWGEVNHSSAKRPNAALQRPEDNCASSKLSMKDTLISVRSKRLFGASISDRSECCRSLAAQTVLHLGLGHSALVARPAKLALQQVRNPSAQCTRQCVILRQRS
jgi:hypothetical protein